MISKRLVDIREFYNLKQIDMAKILEVSRGHYGMWEINKETIPLKKLNLLCNHFDISMDYMVGFNKDKDGNGTHILDNKSIGDKIKLIRKNNNLSQEELGKLLNTNQQSISNYELGKTLILTDFAIVICKKYNISLDWLCGRV